MTTSSPEPKKKATKKTPLKAVPPVETFELSEQDEADLQSLVDVPDVQYHSLLEVWRELLTPAGGEATKRVQPGWASRITGMYPQIKMQQMTIFRDNYFSKIEELKHILMLEIENDPDALQHLTPESDAEENRHHYTNLLLQWQMQILSWELNWIADDELSAVELGAISEVHKMFFAETGVTAYLDNIGFQFDELDQADMSVLLNDLRESSE